MMMMTTAAPNLYRLILPTDDMDRADAFWSEILALPVDVVVPTRHYFATGGAILAVVSPEGHGGTPRPNADCIYVRVPDLDATWECAERLGAAMPTEYPGPGIARREWGHRSFYTEDPFGNPVCFVDDVQTDDTGATAPYAGQPIANLFMAVLPTRNLGRSDAFFEALLGLEPDTTIPGRHTFYCDSCMLSLVDTVENARAHELPDPEFRPNVEVTYFAVPDLDACWETAQKLSLDSIGDHTGAGIDVRPWGERSFYGLDPSGNKVCFVDPETLFTGSASWGQ